MWTDSTTTNREPQELTRIISITSGEYSFSGLIPCGFADFRDVHRWKPFDPSRNWPDLGPRFIAGERAARLALTTSSPPSPTDAGGAEADKEDEDSVTDDKRDLDWSAVLKRTFESYIRGERPNMYGEWIHW